MGMCLQYTPGVVITLERVRNALSVSDKDTVSPISGFNEIVTGATSPGAELALMAYLVAPGDELRALHELTRRTNVLEASLNYLGKASSAAVNKQEVHSFDACPHVVWFLHGSSEQRTFFDRVALKGALTSEDARGNQSLALVIDAEPDHCTDVTNVLAQSYLREQPALTNLTPLILAIRLNSYRFKTVDLWTFCTLLLLAIEVENVISAVNLSVDMTAQCGDFSGLPSPLGSLVYSFPLFERLLDEFISYRCNKSGAPPLVFAGAGNKSLHRVWRLGYPAVLPDVIAVSQLDDNNSGPPDLAQIVDLPAVAPLKPCFGEPKHSPRLRGSSFGCASLAGRWASWYEQLNPSERKLGQFGKLAILMRRSDGFSASDNALVAKPWVPSVIRTVATWHPHGHVPREPRFLEELLARLNSVFRADKREFVLTGSAAYAQQRLIANDALIGTQPNDVMSCRFTSILELLGDLDLLHSGGPLSNEHMELVVSESIAWIKQFGTEEPKLQDNINIHPIRTWGGGIHLLQCVVPDACGFITEAGPINPWRIGPDEGFDRSLDIYCPPDAAWNLNPQFRSGSCGLAIAILIWTNLNLLSARISMVIGLGTISEFHRPSSIDNATLLGRIIGALIAGQGELEECYPIDSLTDGDLTLLFGHNNEAASVRLTRRLRRTMELVGDQQGGIWERAREVHHWIKGAKIRWQNA